MPQPQARIIESEWVATIDGPAVRNGAVAIVAERIAAVGPAAAIREQFPDATSLRLSGCALFPGLVNAHVHLELSHRRAGSAPAGGLGDWIAAMVRQGIAEAPRSSEIVPAAVRRGIDQCIRFGVTAVGDITSQPQLTRPILSKGPLRATSFGEVTGMSSRRAMLDSRLESAADRKWDSASMVAGISPHAPYSVEPDGYAKCIRRARAGGYPLATHLAESEAETEFLAEHSGPLRRVWDQLGGLDADVPKSLGGPIRLADRLGLLDDPTVFAHVNYCDDSELALLASKHHSGLSVVYCPRTHAYFGHCGHRWREMLAVGINVALGTDSCASSPDLNLLDDLRLVREQAPEIAAADLWPLVTTRAAAALRWGDAIGSLTAGKYADMAAYPVEGDDPLESALSPGKLPVAVWIGGRPARPQAPGGESVP